jgi:hypothetical protein
MYKLYGGGGGSKVGIEFGMANLNVMTKRMKEREQIRGAKRVVMGKEV